MADLSVNMNSRVIPAIVRPGRPVTEKLQQEIKSAVHQGLIKRLDLEKIALMHENRVASAATGNDLAADWGAERSPLVVQAPAASAGSPGQGLWPGTLRAATPRSDRERHSGKYAAAGYVERRGVLERTAITLKTIGI